jgi:hypothetical protein
VGQAKEERSYPDITKKKSVHLGYEKNEIKTEKKDRGSKNKGNLRKREGSSFSCKFKKREILINREQKMIQTEHFEDSIANIRR